MTTAIWNNKKIKRSKCIKCRKCKQQTMQQQNTTVMDSSIIDRQQQQKHGYIVVMYPLRTSTSIVAPHWLTIIDRITVAPFLVTPLIFCAGRIYECHVVPCAGLVCALEKVAARPQ